MSMFRKPKKTIQRRAFSSFGDEDALPEDEPKDMVGAGPGISVELNRKTDKKGDQKPSKEKPTRTLLSFGDDEEEEGEVFQVKKSSHSKKVMKMMDKERRKKKTKAPDQHSLQDRDTPVGSIGTQLASKAHSGNGTERSSSGIKSEAGDKTNKSKIHTEIRTDDDFVLVVKKTEPSLVLSGRAAICAGRNDITSDDEEEVDNTSSHRFNQPENVKFFLESGKIPDAAMIHAARKKRQKARELGEFVPIEEKEDKKSACRTENDHDEDHSDEDERIDMNAITGIKEREERREKFYAVQQESADDSDYELTEWENQQIRKGVTGAQLVSAQQESVLSKFLIPIQAAAAHQILDEDNMSTGALLEQAYARNCIDKPKLLQGKAKSEKSGPRMPKEVLQRLVDRLQSVKDLNKKHTEDIDQMIGEMRLLKVSTLEAAQRTPIAEARYRFYQELRGYVCDYVECMDEKVPQIVDLEKRAMAVMSRFKTNLIERHRQDVKDQAKEVSDLALKYRTAKPQNPAEDEDRVRRAAEREGRRTRRRRDRERTNLSESHLDGMSSDDEIPDQEAAQYKLQLQQIAEESMHVFDDTTEEFSSIVSILKRFHEWKRCDRAAYKDAYVSVCLPKIVGPLIRQRMITWNPLDDNCPDFEKMDWFGTCMVAGYETGESEETLAADPDARFVPALIEKIILPKLIDQIENCWNPLSTSQTLKLVGVIGRLGREYPSLRTASKTTQALFTAILEKMKSSLDNDVFIPIFAKQVQEAKTSFFQRQFCSGLKLFRNFLSWQGILSDTHLREIAISALLNRYLLSAMRVCTPNDAISKAHIIVYTLPRVWLQPDSELLPSMEMFTAFLKHIAGQLDPNNAIHMESIEKILKILSSLHASL